MEINNFIKEILYNEDKVALSGIGSFVVEYKSADIDETDTNKVNISPPKRIVHFDNYLKEDDNKLSNFLISYAEASENESKEVLQNFLTDCNQRLENGEKIYFDEIGNLYLDDNKEVQLERDIQSNFLQEAFALADVETTEIAQEKEKTVIVKKKRNKALLIPVALLILIVAAIAVKFIFFPDLDLFSNRLANNTNNTNNVNNTEINNNNTNKNENLVIDEDSILIDNTNNEIVDNNTTENNTDNTTIDNNDTNILPPKKGDFYIIAGSFTNKSGAETVYKELKKQGLSPDILNKDKYYRVSIGQFDNEAQANAEVKRLKKKHKSLSQIWVKEMK